MNGLFMFCFSSWIVLYLRIYLLTLITFDFTVFLRQIPYRRKKKEIHTTPLSTTKKIPKNNTSSQIRILYVSHFQKKMIKLTKTSSTAPDRFQNVHSYGTTIDQKKPYKYNDKTITNHLHYFFDIKTYTNWISLANVHRFFTLQVRIFFTHHKAQFQNKPIRIFVYILATDINQSHYLFTCFRLN